MVRFQHGVSKSSIDAVLACLRTAVSSGELTMLDIRYFLDGARKILLPRLRQKEERSA